MNLLICGINHKTAPIELRERLAIPTHELAEALSTYQALSLGQAVVIVSTCNRTEIIASIAEQQALLAWFAKRQQVSLDELQSHAYCYQGMTAWQHLAKVACGLDSLVLGEPQILGQIKQAYQQSLALGLVDAELQMAFDYTFQIAKRVRTETAIGQSPISIASCAADLIGRHIGQPDKQKLLLIGSGETMQLLAKHLQKQTWQSVAVASRTFVNAEQIANRLQGKAITIDDIPEYLAQADIIASATACPYPILQANELATVTKPQVLIDLAVPRDIDPAIGELPHKHLFNVDNLHDILDSGLQARKQAAIQAEMMILQMSEALHAHKQARNAGSVVSRYRKRMEQVRDEMLADAFQQLQQGQAATEVCQQLAMGLTNKLIHAPSVQLKHVNNTDHEQFTRLLATLYDFEGASNA